jgi:hypothetical protein
MLRRLAAAPVLAALLFAFPALAAAPVGSFEYTLGGRQSIWLGDEDEDFCENFGEAFDEIVHCDFEAFVDGKGKIGGWFEFAGWSGGLLFEQSGPVKGSQRGDGRTGVSSSMLAIKLSGTASDGFITVSSKANIRLWSQTQADGYTIGGFEQTVCVSGFGCSSDEGTGDPVIATNGDWQLELEIVETSPGKLGGEARVELGNGWECFYAISGKYSAKKNVSSLKLEPLDPECAGTSLGIKNAWVQGDELIGDLAYSLYGFTGAVGIGVPVLFPLPGAPPQNPSEVQSQNQQLFDFICASTVALAGGSVDASACSWSIFGP